MAKFFHKLILTKKFLSYGECGGVSSANVYKVESVSMRHMERRDITSCPWCGQNVTLIWVHGHGQCPNCRINVDECCRGEICSIVSTDQIGSKFKANEEV